MTTSLTNDPESTPPAAAAVAPAGELGWDRGTAGYPPPPEGAYYPNHTYAPAGYAPQPGYTPYPPPGWPQAAAISAPKAWPVVVFTLLFGAFGAISAARRQSEANELGLPGRRYWWTFAGSLVGSAVLWLLTVGIVLAVAVPVFLNSRAEATVMTVSQLESNLLASNAAGVAVSGASCAEQVVTSTGAGTYNCQVTFVDGVAQSYMVTVADDGTWGVEPN